MKNKIIEIMHTTCCSKCEYDEATGNLYCHCYDCCIKVISEILKILKEGG